MGLKLLLVVTHNGHMIDDQIYNTITAVKQMEQTFDVAVLGNKCPKVIEQARCIPGARVVISVSHPLLQHALAEPMSEVLLSLIEDYDVIVFASNTTTKNVLPRLAALCDISPITDICGIESNHEFKRPIYAGNIIETVSTSQKKLLLSIRAASFLKTPLDDAPCAKVETRDCKNLSSMTVFKKSQLTKLDRPDLTAAKIVVSGGRGLGSSKDFELVYRLADCLGAAVGASRAAVDAGYVSNDYQVGQTGKIIAPEIYIAVGISGAIQHLAGMKDSRVIIAINKDEDAAIFNFCDYGLVGDLFDVLPKMIDHLEKD